MTKEKVELPYTMEDVKAVTPKLDMSNGNNASLIRQAIRIMPMAPKDIAIAVGFTSGYVRSYITQMKNGGFIRRLDDGRYEYINTPANNQRDTLRSRSIHKARAASSSTAWGDKDGESVEEFLARGGEIDRSPTRLKFDRLTDEEIRANLGRPSSGHQMPTGPRAW